MNQTPAAPQASEFPLAFLIGTWRGEGTGQYPRIRPFAYREEMTFESIEDDFVLYAQGAWFADGGAPVHFERGTFRMGADGGALELCIAHPLGLVEVSEGRLEGTSFTTRSTTIAATATGDPVTALERRWRVDGDVLTYELHMATKRTPLAHHLSGRLVLEPSA